MKSPQTWFIVDVETDGPCPGLYSMVSIGVVKLDRALGQTFYGILGPLPDARGFEPEALAVSGTSRNQHLDYPPPENATYGLSNWVHEVAGDTKPVFVSDNPGFDFAFVSYYMHRFVGKNVFGHSSRRIGDIYSGQVNDASKSSYWRQFRKTPQTHNPVDDAMGVAEALLHMVDHMGLKIEGL